MPLDTALVGALHLESLNREDIPAESHLHHSLFQTSTIEALLDGNYDGDITISELRGLGDFGLGTLDALDGEMVSLDGDFYRVGTDGRAHVVDGPTKTPFAVVTFFEPEPPRTLGRVESMEGLCELIDEYLDDAETCCAVRVDGRFEYVRARSVPRQRKPYPPLIEVVKSQSTFEFRDVPGSLVGFRFPDYAQGINVPGYHFHFITDDRSVGGHLLDCRLAHGELSIDREADLRLELPPDISLPTHGSTLGDDLDRIEKDHD